MHESFLAVLTHPSPGNSHLFIPRNGASKNYMWVIDQACSVNMAGYWPSFHKHAKKEQGQHPATLIEQAWAIKDLLYGIKQNMINFPCWTKPVS